ncbi:hypothetical protein FRC12_022935 [Ceratobasidium sp. 428]|nr:hypothetical protein FRC12_022935 [Ceratobasidium sp. 428]
MATHPAPQMSTTSKEKRAAKRRKDVEIAKALLDVETQTLDTLSRVAKELDIELAEAHARFMMQSTVRQQSKATAWNGLVHEKCKEWEYLKSEYPGLQFINEVSKRISDSGIYKALTDEEKEYYVSVAQKLLDNRLTAGSAGTGESQRRDQGTIKKDLTQIGLQLDHFHRATGVECIYVVVRGNDEQGLKPTYYISDKARRYLETHMKVNVETMLKYLEKSVNGGASGVLGAYKTDTQDVKAGLRSAMVTSLQNAATSTATDGSKPLLDDPAKISSVSWKHYWSIVRTYHVEAFGWPMSDDGSSLTDPSDIGGYGRMLSYLEDVKNNRRGFRRLTDADWDAKMAEYDALVEAGTIDPPTRKTRSDKGASKKRPATADLVSVAKLAKQARTTKAQTKSAATSKRVASTAAAKGAQLSTSSKNSTAVNSSTPPSAPPQRSSTPASPAMPASDSSDGLTPNPPPAPRRIPYLAIIDLPPRI